jgi:hypothetical protein
VSGAEPSREFSVEEANQLLPDLTAALHRIREARQVVLAGAERVRRVAPRNGGGARGKEYWEALQVLRQEVLSITTRGIILRDPESGLVDFPTTRRGQPAFLCWQVGEDRVGYWHGPQGGFGGRRPL